MGNFIVLSALSGTRCETCPIRAVLYNDNSLRVSKNHFLNTKLKNDSI